MLPSGILVELSSDFIALSFDFKRIFPCLADPGPANPPIVESILHMVVFLPCSADPGHFAVQPFEHSIVEFDGELCFLNQWGYHEVS